MYKTLQNLTAPRYPYEMLTVYNPAKRLRSSEATLLSKNHRSITIHIAGPALWNSIPDNLRVAPTLETFSKKLNMYHDDIIII